ncbi:MAG: biopolymer transporter ExbD [Deltaproteobacteria bacterium]|nr:biopolymer transporter ExbD [Deltaproteobacteria bacterium]
MKIRSFRKQPKKARIEIIPMIDTMFFLLVFFMIATLSMTVMRGMQVNLPKAEASKSDLKDDISVTLSKDGYLYFNKQKIQRAELPTLLLAEVSKNPGILVMISADEEVSHGNVVELMDAIKTAGINRLAIATKKPVSVSFKQGKERKP